MENYEYREITKKIIGVAIEVHKKLGPGFPEKVYQRALKLAFKKSNLKFTPEKKFNIEFMGKKIGYEFVDFLIEKTIIVEIKAISGITNIQIAQVVSYLKGTNKKIGLILNFAKSKLEIKRVII
jgi:GxxExxY protein